MVGVHLQCPERGPKLRIWGRECEFEPNRESGAHGTSIVPCDLPGAFSNMSGRSSIKIIFKMFICRSFLCMCMFSLRGNECHRQSHSDMNKIYALGHYREAVHALTQTSDVSKWCRLQGLRQHSRSQTCFRSKSFWAAHSKSNRSLTLRPSPSLGGKNITNLVLPISLYLKTVHGVR